MRQVTLQTVIVAVLLSLGFAGVIAVQAEPVSAVGPGVSEAPRLDTMRVIDGEVFDSAIVGDRVIVVGDFTQVRDVGGEVIDQEFAAAYNVLTGQFDADFRPDFNDVIEAVAGAEDGQAVFFGGAFTEVNGESHQRVAKINLDGSTVSTFTTAANSAVLDIAVANGELFLTGRFNSIDGETREILAAVDAETGVTVPWLNFDFDFSVASGGAMTGRSIAISNDGTQLWLSHTMRFIEGQERTLIAKFDLGDDSVALSDWQTSLYDDEVDRFGGALRPRRIAISPDGTFVVMSTSGGDRPPAGDTAVRFPTDGGQDTQADWVSRHFDTVAGVAISDDTVFVIGHFQYQEAPGSDDPFPGDPLTNFGFGQGAGPSQLGDQVVPREQLGALDPETGKSFDWNPGSDSFLGGQSLTFSPEHGLLVGHDGNRLGGVVGIGRHAIFPLGNDPLPISGDGNVSLATIIDGPQDGGFIAPGSVTFEGQASAPGGVDFVRLAIVQATTGQYLTADGTFVDEFTPIDVQFDGAEEQVEWSQTIDLFEAGSYNVTARSFGIDGRRDESRAETSIRIGTVTDEPPTLLFTSPEAVVTGEEPIVIGGTVNDDVSVTSVSVFIQDRDTFEFLRLDGTLGEADRFPTELSNPGSSFTNWSTVVDFPIGEWRVTADAIDQAGQRVRGFVNVAVVGDTAAPTITINSGNEERQPADSTFTFGGFAEAEALIDKVEIRIRNPLDLSGVQENGSLGPRSEFFPLPGINEVPSSGWSYTTPALPTGSYDVIARVTDSFGVRVQETAQITVGPDGDSLPTLQIDLGTQFQQGLDTLSATLTGTAADESGVARVAMRAFDDRNRLWVLNDGSLGERPQTFEATLDSPGEADSTWSLTFEPQEASTFTLAFFVVDDAGQLSQNAVFATARIFPGELRPEVVLFQPADGQTITTNRINATGEAFDDTALARVEVRIQNVETSEFLNSDGSFGSSEWIPAQQTNPGADRTNWDYSSPLLPDGNYVFQARSVDANDQTSPAARAELVLN